MLSEALKKQAISLRAPRHVMDLFKIYTQFALKFKLKKMEHYIKRERYLQRLIDRRENGEIKIITGSRRCGKSWLLKKIYRDYLIESGVQPDDIITISFDLDDPTDDRDLRNPQAFKSYMAERMKDEKRFYYVMLDEIQELEGFERIVNGLNARENVDVYITGSNSHLLSSDINTIFRGRGDEVRVYPLSFAEYSSGRTEPLNELWKAFYTFGGMPALLHQRTPEQRATYLQRLWAKTYLDDVIDRNRLKNRNALESIVDSLCSSIGSLTNPNRIVNTLESVQRLKINNQTVSHYLSCLEDAFLFESASRYNRTQIL